MRNISEYLGNLENLVSPKGLYFRLETFAGRQRRRPCVPVRDLSPGARDIEIRLCESIVRRIPIGLALPDRHLEVERASATSSTSAFVARSARRCVRERGSTIYGVETPVRVGPERDFGSAVPLAMPRKSEDADVKARVTELRFELEKRGLSIAGRKTPLQERLHEAVCAEVMKV